jgi:hypothetical protein
MIDDITGQEPTVWPLRSSFNRYFQDKGKGRGGEGGNYRRNAAREIERFVEWAAGDSGGDDWTEIVPDDVDLKDETEVNGVNSFPDQYVDPVVSTYVEPELYIIFLY